MCVSIEMQLLSIARDGRTGQRGNEVPRCTVDLWRKIYQTDKLQQHEPNYSSHPGFCLTLGRAVRNSPAFSRNALDNSAAGWGPGAKKRTMQKSYRVVPWSTDSTKYLDTTCTQEPTVDTVICPFVCERSKFMQTLQFSRRERKRYGDLGHDYDYAIKMGWE